MFGYIRPYKPDLSDKDYRVYKAVYCGLCRQLGDDYGVLARAVLSYDAAFLAMIASSIICPETEPVIFTKRCTCNPLKKCGYCCVGDESMKIASAFSVISFCYKLYDTQKDEKLVKSNLAKLLKRIYENSKNAAAKNYPELESIVSDMLVNQFKVEKLLNCSIDRAADPTAKMLSLLMGSLMQDDSKRQIYSDFGYFLGRWIYLIDAIDDFEKDKKNSSFNPIVNKFAGASDVNFENDDFKNYCNGLLNQTAAKIVANYKFMDIFNFNSIINNIIYKGIPEMQRQVIFDRDNKGKCL